ncbi:MAG: RNA methyltransferase [Candidatus Omnitrophica bacterium]|nr:RNA methyltransferase [Candidatus Omnitrophota bacterium]
MRKLTHKEIVSRQEAFPQKPLAFTVILNNIRSLHNVGSVFRTADGVGVEKIWLCGITGYPPDSQIAKTALGAETRVLWDHAYDAKEVICDLKKKGYQIVLLEQTDKSISYHEFIPKLPVCLVLGNEIEGVDDDVVALSDASVEIEMAGHKNSLNVGVAFGIVGYHFRNCIKEINS